MNPVSLSTAVPPIAPKAAAGGAGGVERVAADAVSSTSVSGFGDAMKNALDGISKMQGDANQLSQEFQLNNPNVSLEETMIALQKASLGFQAAVQVRNKLVTAYNDIMNMNV
jgi:flagellar hook-basal body complex protein FliE